MSNLKKEYLETITPNLVKEFNYQNKHEIPKLIKISVSCGLGLNASNRAFLGKATNEIRLITGQHPILTKAKKSIAGFKLRKGLNIGCKVTLRKKRMFEFLDRLIFIALPRVRDFKGLSKKSFDGNGNYSIGIKEQIIFPEIDYDKVDKIRGMDITITTSTTNQDHAYELLKSFNLPFKD